MLSAAATRWSPRGCLGRDWRRRQRRIRPGTRASTATSPSRSSAPAFPPIGPPACFDRQATHHVPPDGG